MPTVEGQEFPYSEEGIMEAEMAAAGINPNEALPEAAEEVADSGRGGDTIAAHLTPGEIVLPPEIADQLYDQIVELVGEDNIGRITVGDPENSINPETGMPEFGFLSRIFGGSQRRKAERAAAAQAKKLKADTARMIAESEKEMKRRMTAFRLDMDTKTAEFNKTLAEDQERSRVMAIRRNRAFKKGLFGDQFRAMKASKESTGTATSPQEFSAPSFFGKRRGKKKLGGKGFSREASKKRPR